MLLEASPQVPDRRLIPPQALALKVLSRTTEQLLWKHSILNYLVVFLSLQAFLK